MASTTPQTQQQQAQQQTSPFDQQGQSEDSKQSRQEQTHQGYPAFAPIPTKLPPPPIRRLSARTSQGSSTEQSQKTDTTVCQPSAVITTLANQSLSVAPTQNEQVHAPVDINNDNTPFNNLPFMSFDFDLNMEPVEWDQFLVDTDLGDNIVNAPADVESPVTTSGSSTPKSTESEQSEALDPEPETAFDFNFDFDMPTSGISHNPADIFGSLLSPTFGVPDNRGATDPTMTSTFGPSFADFDVHTNLGADAAAQLGLTDLLSGFDTVFQPAPLPSVVAPVNDSLADAYAVLDKLLLSQASPTPTVVQPAQLVLSPAPDLKRKASVLSDDGSTTSKRRGRPPGTGKPKSCSPPPAKRPYRRQSKSTAAGISPVLSIGTLGGDADESDADEDAHVKLTASGKPSTARPKSVVPEKFLKDGTAQALLGMTITEIQSFPTFEELLKKVSPSLLAGAKEFGDRIADNRDKAKDAAKKSRDERRAKIERADVLEKKVEQLEAQVQGMTSILLALVERVRFFPLISHSKDQHPSNEGDKADEQRQEELKRKSGEDGWGIVRVRSWGCGMGKESTKQPSVFPHPSKGQEDSPKTPTAENLFVLETALRSSYRAGFRDALRLSPFMPFTASSSSALSSTTTLPATPLSRSSSASFNDDMRSATHPVYFTHHASLYEKLNTPLTPVILISMALAGTATAFAYRSFVKLRGMERRLDRSLSLIWEREGDTSDGLAKIREDLMATRAFIEARKQDGNGAYNPRESSAGAVRGGGGDQSSDGYSGKSETMAPAGEEPKGAIAKSHIDPRRNVVNVPTSVSPGRADRSRAADNTETADIDTARTASPASTPLPDTLLSTTSSTSLSSPNAHAIAPTQVQSLHLALTSYGRDLSSIKSRLAEIQASFTTFHEESDDHWHAVYSLEKQVEDVHKNLKEVDGKVVHVQLAVKELGQSIISKSSSGAGAGERTISGTQGEAISTPPKDHHLEAGPPSAPLPPSTSDSFTAAPITESAPNVCDVMPLDEIRRAVEGIKESFLDTQKQDQTSTLKQDASNYAQLPQMVSAAPATGEKHDTPGMPISTSTDTAIPLPSPSLSSSASGSSPSASNGTSKPSTPSSLETTKSNASSSSLSTSAAETTPPPSAKGRKARALPDIRGKMTNFGIRASGCWTVALFVNNHNDAMASSPESETMLKWPDDSWFPSELGLGEERQVEVTFVWDTYALWDWDEALTARINPKRPTRRTYSVQTTLVPLLREPYSRLKSGNIRAIEIYVDGQWWEALNEPLGLPGPQRDNWTIRERLGRSSPATRERQREVERAHQGWLDSAEKVLNHWFRIK